MLGLTLNWSAADAKENAYSGCVFLAVGDSQTIGSLDYRRAAFRLGSVRRKWNFENSVSPSGLP